MNRFPVNGGSRVSRFAATRAFAAEHGADDFVQVMETMDVGRAVDEWLTVSRARYWHDEENRDVYLSMVIDSWREPGRTSIETAVGIIEGILNRTRSLIAAGVLHRHKRIAAPPWHKDLERTIRIDEGIAPLLREVWRVGLQTLYSCEGYYDEAYIDFGNEFACRLFCWALTGHDPERSDWPAGWRLEENYGGTMHFPRSLLPEAPALMRAARPGLATRWGVSARRTTEIVRARRRAYAAQLAAWAAPPLKSKPAPSNPGQLTLPWEAG